MIAPLDWYVGRPAQGCLGHGVDDADFLFLDEISCPYKIDSMAAGCLSCKLLASTAATSCGGMTEGLGSDCHQVKGNAATRTPLVPLQHRCYTGSMIM